MEETINTEELLDKSMTPVAEPIVEFKMFKDRAVYEVINPDTKESMVKISGYDVAFEFNMERLRCIEDIEAACAGISQLFREIILEKLLEHKQKD